MKLLVCHELTISQFMAKPPIKGKIHGYDSRFCHLKKKVKLLLHVCFSGKYAFMFAICHGCLFAVTRSPICRSKNSL